MWPKSYSSRLTSWHSLRKQCQSNDLLSCMTLINHWWMNAPWCAYRLHWDDQKIWPNPWQLLEEKNYCTLARGLGIVYTICLINRSDMQDAVLCENSDTNLVYLCNSRYILNWGSELLINNSLINLPKRHVTQAQIQERL